MHLMLIAHILIKNFLGKSKEVFNKTNMNTEIKICKQCILKSITPGIEINEEGLCSECSDYLNRPKPNYQKYVEEMEKRFKEVKKAKKMYDAIVCFSGGKDSAYLLYMLKNKYQLNVLACGVIHPFLNSLSSNNMEEVTKKLNIDLIKFYVDEGLFKQVIKLGILKRGELGIDELLHGCCLCTTFHYVIPYKLAIKMGIPYFITGIDSSQSGVPLLIDGKDVKLRIENRQQFPFYFLGIFRSILGESFNGSIYDFDNVDGEFPTEIVPHTFMGYDYNKNINELNEAGILSKEKSHSLITNCSAHHFFSYFAFKNFNCHSYEKIIANGLRIGSPSPIDQFGGIKHREQFSREETLNIIENYKDLLFFIAMNPQIYEKDLNKLFKKYEIFTNLMGKDKLMYMIKDMQKIHYYSKYFDIKL